MFSLEIAQNPSGTEIGQKRRILVVEDEELIREMLVMALQEQDYEVLTAADGQKAVSILQNASNETAEPFIDLVVLDIMLPLVNGLDICRLLRRQGNPVPILILSAKGSETDRKSVV